jgi:chaperonin GroES
VSTSAASPSRAKSEKAAALDEKLPIRMLHDRVLVSTEGEQGERRST